MDYFSNKNSTNIDDELKQNSLFNSNKKKLMIVLISLVLIVISVIVILSLVNKGSYSIVIDGEQNIKIYVDSEYIEPGYHGYDKQGNDVTNQVVVNSNINTKEIGEYTVTYSLKNKIITRYISVIDKGVGTTYMYLNGDKTIYLKKGEKYIEPGYVVIDTIDTNLKDKIVIVGTVNSSKPGSYRLVYSVVNSTGVTTSTSRTVIVLGSEINLNLSTKSSTTAPIYIKVSVKDNYFDYLVLPNGSKVKESEYSYKVSKNGTYKFTVYDTFGTKTEESIKVSNIKIVSTNSSNNSNTDSHNSVDSSSSNSNNSDTIKPPSSPESSVNESSGSSSNSTSNSSLSDSYYKEITPTGNENIIYNVNTENMKVWIELTNRNDRTSYYTTHIWVKDAYNQFKSQVPDNFGNELLTAHDLLNNAVKQNNLQSKVVVGINASGFVQYGLWGNAYYEANPKFEKTSKSPIVIVNGHILRDLSDQTLPTYRPELVYGLNKKSDLTYYQYAGGNNTESNIKTSNQIKNDGILNTFSFYPVIVYNGILKSNATEQNIRQGICQIDKNNFVFITNVYVSSRNGFSMQELGNYMISLGCKTGFNLDGGGSTSLIFKDRNKSLVDLTTTNRKIADIIYFHE